MDIFLSRIRESVERERGERGREKASGVGFLLLLRDKVSDGEPIEFHARCGRNNEAKGGTERQSWLVQSRNIVRTNMRVLQESF